MKLFSEVAIGEMFVVAGGFVLVKTSDTKAVFPDAENVGEIPHSLNEPTYTEAEFNAMPKQEQAEALFA